FAEAPRWWPAALLRAHLSRSRARRRGAARGGALRRRACALYRARNSFRRARAELHARLPRRDPGAAAAGRGPPLGRARTPVRGIPGARGERRQARALAQADRQTRAAARPLPPEILRRHGGGRGGTEPRARFVGRNRRLELLRHGGGLRLWCRYHRR